MAPLPSGEVTLLFTDIEGSTPLLDALGDAYADLLTTHRRVLREVWDAHRGVEVETEGDSFFVAFPDASDAVRATIAGRSTLIRKVPRQEPLRSRSAMDIPDGRAEAVNQHTTELPAQVALRSPRSPDQV